MFTMKRPITGVLNVIENTIFAQTILKTLTASLILQRAKIYPIKHNLNCSSKNVIYLASCIRCKLKHVDSTSTQFKIRFRNHKFAMLTRKILVK